MSPTVPSFQAAYTHLSTPSPPCCADNPITILFRWDQQGRENEIGVYLGPIAAFTVKGSWTWKPNKPVSYRCSH